MPFYLPKKACGLALAVVGVCSMIGGGQATSPAITPATTPAPTAAPTEIAVDTITETFEGAGTIEVANDQRRLAIGDPAPLELFDAVRVIVEGAVETAAADAGAIASDLSSLGLVEIEGTNPIAITYDLAFTATFELEVGTDVDLDDIAVTITAEIVAGAAEAEINLSNLTTIPVTVAVTPAPTAAPTAAPTTAAPVCVPGPDVPTAECMDCQALCAAQGTTCFIDETCPYTQGGLGCNLFGIPNCRGCGGSGIFASITCGACPMEPSTECAPAPAPTMAPVMAPTLMPVTAPSPVTSAPVAITAAPVAVTAQPVTPVVDECTDYCSTYYPNDLSCYTDPICADGAAGCGAHASVRSSSGVLADALCRFCGGDFPACPTGDSGPTPTPTPVTAAPVVVVTPTPTTAPTSPADECSVMCSTMHPTAPPCVTDPTCATRPGVGCNAHGVELCRFQY